MFVTYRSPGCDLDQMMSMEESAMAELGWHNGMRIDADQVFEGIAANARAFCTKMEKLRGTRDGIPDTTRLEALCGYTA